MIRAIAAAAVAAAAFLAGCSAPAPNQPKLDVPVAPEQAAAVPSAPGAPAANMSERGNVMKQLGEIGAFGPTQDNLVVSFAIDKITVDAKCTAQYSMGKPEHGHFVKVDLRAETKPNMPADGFYSINGAQFSTVGEDGLTESSLFTGPAIGCLDEADQFPTGQLAPGSKYRGSIIIDTKNPSGVLMLKPTFMGAGGWEWTYGK
jgi:hypothetical protein